MRRLATLITSALLASSCAGAAQPAEFPSPSNLHELRAVYHLDPGAERVLRQNGFVVLDSISRPTLAAAYPDRPAPFIPKFVSTDAFLQLWYQLYRKELESAERKTFLPETVELIRQLTTSLGAQAAGSTDPDAAAAISDARVSLGVAARLLGDTSPIPPRDSTQVESLVSRIFAHHETGVFPAEDFTQYTVRGHYTGDPELGRYFRATMWLSRHIMPVDAVPGLGDRRLREAIALADAVRANPPTRARLAGLNRTRIELGGAPNGVSVDQLCDALDRALGRSWTLTAAMQPSGLARLRSELSQPSYPRSQVWTTPTAPDRPFPGQTISLLPSLALPDSQLFQSTVHPRIPARSLPSPLEVAAALGSPTARRELRQKPQAEAVLGAIASAQPFPDAGDSSLYSGWMGVLSTLYATDSRAPEAMRGTAWEHKSLNTSLASWAQLRHETVLYGAQSHAGGIGTDFSRYRGYVEPNPVFFRSLGTLAERCRKALTGQAADPAVQAQSRWFEAECREFASYSDAEMEGRLTESESDVIARFQGKLVWNDEAAAGPIVADVATGVRGEVLHVATGPFHLILFIPDRKQPIAFAGWVSSYFELVRPASRRLTDSRWRTIQASSLRPQPPEWTVAFLYRVGEDPAEARLRRAEQLLASQSPQAGEAALRALVRDRPGSPQAVKAQSELGAWYEDRGRLREALAAYRKCARFYGGVIRDRALERAAQLEEKLRPDVAPPGTPQVRSDAAEAQLGRVEALPSSAPGREREELRLAALVLAASQQSWFGVSSATFERSAQVMHRPGVADLLRYDALRVELRRMAPSADPEPWQSFENRIERFARSTRNETLRLAARCLPITGGRIPAQPEELMVRITATVRRGSPGDLGVPPALLSEPELIGQPSDLGVFSDLRRARSALQDRLVGSHFWAGEFEGVLRVSDDVEKRQPQERTRQEVEVVRAYSETERIPLAAFVRARALLGQSGGREEVPSAAWHAAAGAFEEVWRRFPSSSLAPFALLQAAHAASQANDGTAAQRFREALHRQYSTSVAALADQLLTAAERRDAEPLERLLPQLDAACKRQLGADWLLLAPAYVPYVVQKPFEETRKLRQGLLPIFKAAGQSDRLRELSLAGSGSGILRRANQLVPGHEPELMAAIINAGLGGSTSRELLARYPDDPNAIFAWRDLYGDLEMTDLPLLAHLVNRGPRYRFRDESEKALRWAVARGEETDERAEEVELYLSLVDGCARRVISEYPRTRAAGIAGAVLAGVLQKYGRPEEALKVGGPASKWLTPADPLRGVTAILLLRARTEIAAKRQPEPRQRWRAQLPARPSDPINRDRWERDDGIGFPDADVKERRGSCPATCFGGLLLVPTGNGNKTTLRAVDQRTGRLVWSAATGVLSDLALAGGRVLCGTARGTLLALDAKSGSRCWEKVLDVTGQRPVLVEVLGADAAAHPVGGELTVVDARTAKLRWARGDVHPMGRALQWPGLVLTFDNEGVLWALDAATGITRWSNKIAGEHSGVLAAAGKHIVAVRGRFVALLQPETGAILRSVKLSDMFNEELIYASADRLVFQGATGVLDTSTVRAADLVREPNTWQSHVECPEMVAEGVGYGRNRFDRLCATDLFTSADLGEYPSGSEPGDQLAAGSLLFVIRASGSVEAYPLLGSR